MSRDPTTFRNDGPHPTHGRFLLPSVAAALILLICTSVILWDELWGPPRQLWGPFRHWGYAAVACLMVVAFTTVAVLSFPYDHKDPPPSHRIDSNQPGMPEIQGEPEIDMAPGENLFRRIIIIVGLTTLLSFVLLHTASRLGYDGYAPAPVLLERPSYHLERSDNGIVKLTRVSRSRFIAVGLSDATTFFSGFNMVSLICLYYRSYVHWPEMNAYATKDQRRKAKPKGQIPDRDWEIFEG